MNILIVGGAGTVGSILRPALESRYSCYYYDLKPVPGAENRTTVADIENVDALTHALAGMQVVVNLAMGVKPGTVKECTDIDAAFNVNVRGAYRLMNTVMEAGIRRVVYSSTLSVYEKGYPGWAPIDERRPPDRWEPYGMSKRMGELLCEGTVQHWPDAGIVVLRLFHPLTEQEAVEYQQKEHKDWTHPLMPNDSRRLFIAAIEHTKKHGLLTCQATGDQTGEWYPNAVVTRTLGWKPEGN